MANYLLKNVPDALWKKFRHICIDKDDNIRERIIKLIENDIALQKEKPNGKGTMKSNEVEAIKESTQ